MVARVGGLEPRPSIAPPLPRPKRIEAGTRVREDNVEARASRSSDFDPGFSESGERSRRGTGEGDGGAGFLEGVIFVVSDEDSGLIFDGSMCGGKSRLARDSTGLRSTSI